MKAKKLLTPSERALEKKRAYGRKYYRAHREKARKYYQDNAEKIKARAAQWRIDNPEKYRMQQLKYDITWRGSLTTMQRLELIHRRLKKNESRLK